MNALAQDNLRTLADHYGELDRQIKVLTIKRNALKDEIKKLYREHGVVEIIGESHKVAVSEDSRSIFSQSDFAAQYPYTFERFKRDSKYMKVRVL